jgi:aminomethyltransferase
MERGIGMAYLPAQQSEPGTTLQIDVRGKERTAVVQSKPLYKKEH